MKNASSTEKTYYKFSGIRNPLDTAVSMYFKLKNEPRFLDPLYPTKNKDNFIRATYIASNKADFNDFFMRFLTRNIYDEIKTHDFNKLNYIYRFENIQEEFSRILTRLGLNQIRPLPLIKKHLNDKLILHYIIRRIKSGVQPGSYLVNTWHNGTMIFLLTGLTYNLKNISSIHSSILKNPSRTAVASR